MIAWVIVLIGGLTAATAAAWWWFRRCEHACLEVDLGAQNLFERGELLSALALIDAVDARCHCARFSSGDAPPQYALAQTCLLQLLSKGRSAEVESLLRHARGPILRELADLIGQDV